MTKIVMFVDDDEAYQLVLTRVSRSIASIGTTMAAFNGAQAIDMLEQGVAGKQPIPHVAFVDINMPVMDGFEFLERLAELRQRHPELLSVRPVVMLTSSDEQRDRSRAAQLGADQYIVKSASLEDTRSTIETFLG